MVNSAMRRYLAEGDPYSAFDDNGVYTLPELRDQAEIDEETARNPRFQVVNQLQQIPAPDVDDQDTQPGFSINDQGEPITGQDSPYLREPDSGDDAVAQAMSGMNPGHTTVPPPSVPQSRQRSVIDSQYGIPDALQKAFTPQSATNPGGYPVRPAPKWWEKLAAAGVGGLAGWSNAASRTRNPIDIAKSTEAILYPGYDSKLAQWQSRVMPAQQMVEAQLKQEQIGAQAEYRKAQAQERLARAAPHFGQREIDPAYARDPSNNLMWLAPEIGADGKPHYYIDKSAEANLTKQIPASKLIPNPEGGLYDPDQGKLVTPGWQKPITNETELWQRQHPNGTAEELQAFLAANKAESEPSLRLKAAHGDPDAIKAVKLLDDEMARRSRESRPPASSTTVNFAGTPALNGQPAQVDPFIKAIGDYEAQPPAARSSSPASIKTYRDIIQAVKLYNPQWDMKNYGVVQAGLKDFGSGKTSQTIDALNTVSGHLLTLDSAATALKNNDINALNRIGNAWGIQMGTTGGSAVAKYNTIVHRVGPELGRSYGTATEGENNVNQADFDASRGPDLIHGAIATSAQLLNGKIASLEHRWNTNVKKYNPSREFESVSPEAKNAFQKLSGAGAAQQYPPVPATLSPADKGKTFTNKSGQHITITDINPQNPKLFKFQAAQ